MNASFWVSQEVGGPGLLSGNFISGKLKKQKQTKNQTKQTKSTVNLSFAYLFRECWDCRLLWLTCLVHSRPGVSATTPFSPGWFLFEAGSGVLFMSRWFWTPVLLLPSLIAGIEGCKSKSSFKLERTAPAYAGSNSALKAPMRLSAAFGCVLSYLSWNLEKVTLAPCS